MKLLLFMPAPPLWGCLCCLLLLGGATGAQTPDPEPVEATTPAEPSDDDLPIDDFTHREVVNQHSVLRYAPVREADILWEKRLWRVIDIREKMNLPFAYPNAPLAEILGTAALNGDLKVYDTEDDRFTKVLDAGALDKVLFKVDTLITVDPVTYEETVKIVRNAIDWSAVKRFRLKEAWFFDTRTGTLRFRILGIAPLIDVANSEGDFMYERPLFWVHYPSIRPFLARQKVYAPGGNMAATITWEDLFEMRYFASTVYKESNPYDRRIQDYLTGVDGLHQAANINNALLNQEHDLWSW